LRKHSPPLAVVGLFRAHRRRGLYMDVADLALFKDYMSGPQSASLLVRPDPNATGGFFFREGDAVRVQAAYKAFPFDAPFLRPNSTRIESPTPIQLPTAEAGPHQSVPRLAHGRVWTGCA